MKINASRYCVESMKLQTREGFDGLETVRLSRGRESDDP